MNERRYTREEAMDAMMAAASQADGGSSDDSVSESELLAMAGEMGVDSVRLREVLSRGTGTIQVRDEVSKGWAWPGNETFERVIDGELTAGQLEELADLIGARYEDAGTPGVRETREFWEGFRYVTVDISVRDGKTRVLARSKISTMRLAPFFPILMVPMMMFFAFAIKSDVGNLEEAIQGVLAIGLLAYFGVGWGMKGSRTRIVEKVDRLAGATQDQIKESRVFHSPTVEAEILDRVRE
ncbi:MAG: hypothetical protein ACKVQS_09915 [Fimbriimonadaceae bacterium]